MASEVLYYPNSTIPCSGYFGIKKSLWDVWGFLLEKKQCLSDSTDEIRAHRQWGCVRGTRLHLMLLNITGLRLVRGLRTPTWEKWQPMLLGNMRNSLIDKIDVPHHRYKHQILQNEQKINTTIREGLALCLNVITGLCITNEKQYRDKTPKWIWEHNLKSTNGLRKFTTSVLAGFSLT